MRLSPSAQRALDTIEPADLVRAATMRPPSRSALAAAIDHAAEVEAEWEAELMEQWEAEEREAAAARLAAERTHPLAA